MFTTFADTTFVFPVVREEFINPALDSLHEHTPEGYKTIVVDQTRRGLRVDVDLVLRPKVNYGFAQASNLGTRLATTEYVTIANDDVVFLPNWWQGILQTFAKFENAMVVGPMSMKEPGWGWGEKGYRLHDGESIETEMDSDDPKFAAFLERLQAEPSIIGKLIKQFNGAVVDGMAMWLVTFKRQEWVDLGMFDERFMKGGGEDYDACARIYMAGYRALSTSFSWVWHWWGQSKDRRDGLSASLPPARPNWNKLSTKGFGAEGLWHPDVNVWGRDCQRTDPEVWRAPL